MVRRLLMHMLCERRIDSKLAPSLGGPDPMTFHLALSVLAASVVLVMREGADGDSGRQDVPEATVSHQILAKDMQLLAVEAEAELTCCGMLRGLSV